jgi:glycosyltransferase involved in cell wall biosynthesis
MKTTNLKLPAPPLGGIGAKVPPASATQPMLPERWPLRIAVIGIRGVPCHYSGPERACESLFAILAERGHQVFIYCRPEHHERGRDEYRGMGLISTPALRNRSLETLSHVGSSLVHAILRGHYDLVHFQTLAPNLFAPICRAVGLPTVATVRGLDWQRAKWKGAGARVIKLAERCMVRNVDEIICVSHDLQAYYWKTYRKETTYVPNGLDLSTMVAARDDNTLRQFGLTPKRYIACISRLVPEKRVQDLIAAFRRIDDASLRLAIVGEARHSAGYFEQLVALARGDDRIVFTGLQRGTALATLFTCAALYVSCSEVEGLPNSVLETIGYGTPAVLSDIPPHRELIGGVADYDLFVPPGNVDRLTERLLAGLAHLRRYEAIARRARESVVDNYNWIAIANRTEEIYSQLGSKKLTVSMPQRRLST